MGIVRIDGGGYRRCMRLSEGEMMSWLDYGVIALALYWLFTGPFKHGRPKMKGAGDGAWRVQ